MNQLTPSHAPRKKFGQNFLVDTNVIEKIINRLALKDTDQVLEIGPGRGALTTYLHQQLPILWAVELDRDLITPLRARFKNLQLHEGDALKFDYLCWANERLADNKQPLRLVGNLPYNVATPLLFRFIDAIDMWQDLNIMVQKEVADRMMASAGSKTYGRLSVMCNYYFTMRKLLEVKPGAFFPAPKVMSTVVQLIPKTKSERAQCNPLTLEHVVKAAFATRRKKLSNCLRGMFSIEQMQALGINHLRAENLSLAQYINLAQCHDRNLT